MSSAFGFIQILVILLIHLQYLDSSFVSNIVPYLVSCLGAEPLDEVPHLLLRDVGVLDQLNINMKHFYLTVKPGLWIRIRIHFPFNMQIRIRINVQVQVQLNQICRKKS